jgi:hypothetical protein
VVAAPDVVDQDVEPAPLGIDPRQQLAHLRRFEVVADDRHGLPSGLGGPSGGALDGLGPIDLGSTVLAATSGGVDDRPGGGELDREGASCAAGGPGHERDLPGQRLTSVHRSVLGRSGVEGIERVYINLD